MGAEARQPAKKDGYGEQQSAKKSGGRCGEGCGRRKKIRAEGAADEKADREADKKGGGSIRLAKQNRSRRCTETAFALYIYKVYKSV